MVKRNRKPWSRSMAEEVIGCLWLIMAFVALCAECPKWVFIPLFIKGGSDLITSIKFAIIESKQDLENKEP